MPEFIKIKTSLQTITESFSKITNGQILKSNEISELRNNIRTVRNACAQGEQIQNYIIDQPETGEIIKYLTEKDLGDNLLVDLSWQFLANLSVQNNKSQKFLWDKLGETLQSDIRNLPIDKNTDKKVMMLYNICIGGLSDCNDKLCLSLLADLWNRINEEKCNEQMDFTDIFFEHFLVNNQWTVRAYAGLSAQNRIDILKYITTYIKNDSPNGSVRRIFMEFIAKEFKKKCDCILKSAEDMENLLHPQEVYQLLQILARASGSDLYDDVYSHDTSLFMSVGSLLKSVMELEKNNDSRFKPMNKLEEVAPISRINADFESEVTYQLKTLLIRTIANMLHTNRGNQRHCIDINLLPALLESTVMDARNPLMREWSILAIRNACRYCPEIQQIIANLTRSGYAPNELLKELNIDVGSLRIQPRD